MPAEEDKSAGSSERKYQIFISSTFRDLAEQRRMVLDVVVDRGHMPIALERFPAADETVPSVIQKTVAASQIYVVILGYRYGAIAADHGISFSELEYRIAVDQGKIVVPFLLLDEEVAARRKELHEDLKQAEARLEDYRRETVPWRELKKHIADGKTELAHDALLADFRSTVANNRLTKFFSLKPESPQRFERYLVQTALEVAEQKAAEARVTGWIREPQKGELAEALAALSGNRFLVDVVEAMATFYRLDARVRHQADAKEAAARFFADKYLERLVAERVGLFFESGSTVAYVADVVGERLGQRGADYRIGTNNVLAYLIFWMVYRFRCSLFPWGPPEQPYGAVFGPIDKRVPVDMTPSFPPEPLSSSDKEAIRQLLEDQYSPAKWPKPVLLLAALSGLQLTPDPAIANCLGPHVGSPRNKVFKRFMYDAGQPVMIFMTASKIDSKVDTSRCHFILDQRDDQDLSWTKFLRERPIAFCVGCKNEPAEFERAIEHFKRLDLQILRAEHKTPYTAFVARNRRFIEDFELQLSIL